MKAIVYYQYGSPDVLKYEGIEKPTPKDNEVLIKVRVASVNPYDWHFMRGEPYFLRLMAGLSKPKETRLGVDGAGQVEAVGRDVTQFKPGDSVFGACRGAFAEYACASERALAEPDLAEVLLAEAGLAEPALAAEDPSEPASSALAECGFVPIDLASFSFLPARDPC